ncbi:unnamed protein product, partial [Protopolystoma xenopodis]
TTSWQRVFCFSGLSQEERDHYSGVVVQLGGEVDGQLIISQKATHLIVSAPGRNEKYLTCLASGRWLLHKSYLDACSRESRWLPEHPYEWGGPGTEPLLVQLSPGLSLIGVPGSRPGLRQPAPGRDPTANQLRELARAARYWRQRGGMAFANWHVLLGPGCDRETSFRRIIEAGQGEVKHRTGSLFVTHLKYSINTLIYFGIM